jgi:hypothetical protein
MFTPYDEEAFRRRRTIELDLQMRDVRNLFSSADAVDIAYLRAWAPALGVAERLREVVPE